MAASTDIAVTKMLMQVIPILAAVVPALLLMAPWSLRHHYKPLREAIWVSFGLGLSVAIPVVAVEYIYLAQIEQIGDLHSFIVAKAFLAAAIPEETAKFLIVIYFSLRHQDLTRPLDALILAVAVSLGFAAIENVTNKRQQFFVAEFSASP